MVVLLLKRVENDQTKGESAYNEPAQLMIEEVGLCFCITNLQVTAETNNMVPLPWSMVITYKKKRVRSNNFYFLSFSLVFCDFHSKMFS